LDKIKSVERILIKKLRTYFFFAEPNENILHFLKNTEVEFRLTDGPKWNKPIAFASSFPFTHFDVSSNQKEYISR
jgi:hypothetical protein